MHTLRPGVMEKVVLLVAMSYLAMCHIYRVVYDYGGYTLDITGLVSIKWPFGMSSVGLNIDNTMLRNMWPSPGLT